MSAYKPESVSIINRLISHLPDDWGIFIHIDKKSSISIPDIDARAHVYSFIRYTGVPKSIWTPFYF